MKDIKNYIPAIAIIGIISNVVLHALGAEYAQGVTLTLLLLGLIPLLWEMVGEIARGKFGVDLIALVAIITSIFVGQYLAGAVVLLMLSGGEALEAYAMRRARRELTRLLSGMPTIAHVKRKNQEIVDMSIDDIRVDDIVVVKPGEIIPVDGSVVTGNSLVDESPITGESVPVEVEPASPVLSGSINKNGVLEIRTVHESKDSKYQQLISLVKQAEEHKAPIVRLADRYTVIFTVATFALAIIAWLVSHDMTRVLAVFVVATPCPLILATPIAIIAGISRAAKRGIIIKDGGALETLSRVRSFVFDKTGTITLGTPDVAEVVPFGANSAEHVITIAASLDQLSTHILARSLLRYAKRGQLKLQYPDDYKEFFGDGVVGILDRKYYFGKLSFLQQQGISVPDTLQRQHDDAQGVGVMSVYVANTSSVMGVIRFSDKMRPESKKMFARFRDYGVRLMMLTGDRQHVAQHIAKQVGIEEVYAEFLPEQKMAKIQELQDTGFGPVAMVGDGINDAAALAAADVGLALGVHGSSASSEAGDVVIAVNNVRRVEDAFLISRRTITIALQSIVVGMGLSVGLMFFAAGGYIEPVVGALLQEAIDVIVILNALRALR